MAEYIVTIEVWEGPIGASYDAEIGVPWDSNRVPAFAQSVDRMEIPVTAPTPLNAVKLAITAIENELDGTDWTPMAIADVRRIK